MGIPSLTRFMMLPDAIFNSLHLSRPLLTRKSTISRFTSVEHGTRRDIALTDLNHTQLVPFKDDDVTIEPRRAARLAP
jgi:hypothetical protein